MRDLVYLFLATVPIAIGLAFVLVAWRDRRHAQAVPARAIEPGRR